MPKKVTDRTRIVSQEAAYWYIRCCDERAMLRADRQLFYAWLKRSPENVAEILRMMQMDGRFNRQRLLDRAGNLDESNVYDINNGGLAANYDYNPSDSVSDERIVKSKTRPVWALAAMIGAISIALLLGFAVIENRTEGEVQTAASQWQQMTLEDGSSVHMDARTRLKVEFSDERRLVRLYEGQAVFEVVKNPDRPFTVSTHIVDVTAVGTRFGVAIGPGVTTTVSEGVVRVTAHGKPDDPAAVHLHQGEQLRVLEAADDGLLRLFGLGARSVDLAKIGPIRVDAVRKLDWTTGWLRFEDETIGEAIIEFNRRNIEQIEIEDRELANRPLGFYRVRVSEPESFTSLLNSRKDLAVIKDGSRYILKAE